MPFTAALSTATDTSRALAEVCEQAVAGWGERSPSLVLVFFSPHHAGEGALIAKTLADRFGPNVVGCQGESIVGTALEIEMQPALSLWMADFGPGVEVETFHIVPDQGREGPTLFGWPDGLLDCDPAKAAMITLADPHTFPITELFYPRIAEDYPGLPVMGGMSSGAMGPGQTVMIRGGEAAYHGAVGAFLRTQGEVPWRTVVSQGCRPIGRPLVVTRGRDNVIQEVGGQTPLSYLQSLYEELPARDQELFRRGLHVGLVMTEFRETFARGDFLIRNLYGIDRENGALVITDRVRAGQTIQFQLRDAETADDDLRALLRSEPAGSKGALLFTCNGRGSRLFSAPHHDGKVVQEELGTIPTAGFFAAGELGPIGSINYIHGFTASIVLFHEVSPPA